MNVPIAAVAAVARNEIRRHWRALIVFGLLAGVVGGAVVGALTLARRTATAHERLESAVHVEDARVLMFDRTLVDEVSSLPGVRSTWEASLSVAKLERPGVNYLGITTGPARPPDLYTPIVIAGRAFRDDAPDEAVVLEQAAQEIGVGVGDELPLKFLTPEEVASFDTGFGEPDGPSFTLHITGIVRVAGDLGGSPVFASPAFDERYAEYAAGTSLFVRLDDDPQTRTAFLDGAARLNDAADPIEGAEEFDPIEVTNTFRSGEQVLATSRVLVGGLAVFIAVVAMVGLVALVQVVARQQAGSGDQQRIEAALGLTAGDRVLARAIPAALAGGVAALVTFALALMAGVLEPSGVIRRVEPNPGWSPNLTLAALGALASGTMAVVVSAVAARRAGANATSPAQAPGRGVRIARAITARPAVVAGLAFAFGGASGGRRVPLRSSLVGVIVGVAGLVAAFTFASSLDRLADTPSRYGWNGDFAVIDVNDSILDELAADPRIEAVTLIESKSFVVDGVTLQAYSHRDRLGTTGWSIIEGHAPISQGEAVLTRQTADRLGRRVGDALTITDAAGAPVELALVGIGIGTNSSNEQSDELALLNPNDLARLGRSQAFNEALVRAAPGADVDALIASYAPRYELQRREMPTDVANVVELGRLPEALGGFLAVIALVALVHLLVVTTARRARDLAVLRALGLAPREVARVVTTTALAITATGLVVGLPLGFAIGRLVWWAVADAIGVASDASYALLPTLVLVPVVLVVAATVAWLPARRAARSRPMMVLRAE